MARVGSVPAVGRGEPRCYFLGPLRACLGEDLQGRKKEVKKIIIIIRIGTGNDAVAHLSLFIKAAIVSPSRQEAGAQDGTNTCRP